MATPVQVPAPGSLRRLRHDAVVLRQGEPSGLLFLIRSGLIRLSSVTAEGREVVVALLGAGQVFGESALLGEASPVEARAVGDSQVVAIEAASIALVVRRMPATATELLRLLASRLHQTSGALGHALSSDVSTRVTQRLRELAADHGSPTEDGVRIGVRLTQDELARMVGASREAVNRTLRSLAERDLVRTRGSAVVLPDPEALGTR